MATKAQKESLFRSVASDADPDEVAPKKMAELFARLSLTKSVLRDIWAEADVDKNNDLTRPRFFRALELIAMLLSNRSATLAALQALTPAERAALPVPTFETFRDAFERLCDEAADDTDSPNVNVKKAGRIMNDCASLDRDTLRTLWNLADRDNSEAVTRARLTTTMQLVSLAQAGKPATLEALDAMDRSLIPPPAFKTDKYAAMLASDQSAKPKAKAAAAATAATAAAGSGSGSSDSDSDSEQRLAGPGYSRVFTALAEPSGLISNKSMGRLFADVADLSKGRLKTLWDLADSGEGLNDRARLYRMLALMSVEQSAPPATLAKIQGAKTKAIPLPALKPGASIATASSPTASASASARPRSKAARARAETRDLFGGDSSDDLNEVAATGRRADTAKADLVFAVDYTEQLAEMLESVLTPAGAVDAAVFPKMLAATGLSRAALASIWAEAKASALTPETAMAALRLCSLAQDGKEATAARLAKMDPRIIPPPRMADSASPRGGAGAAGSASVGGQALSALPSEDSLPRLYPAGDVTVSIDQIAAGAFTKHTVYRVSVASKQLAVERRYSDFVWLHEQLTVIFPYRAVPLLPSKKTLGKLEEGFVAERCRRIQMFTTELLARPLFQQGEAQPLFRLFFLELDYKRFEKTRKLFKAMATEAAFHSHRQSAASFVPDGITVVLKGYLGDANTLATALGRIYDTLAEINSHHEALAGLHAALTAGIEERGTGRTEFDPLNHSAALRALAGATKSLGAEWSRSAEATETAVLDKAWRQQYLVLALIDAFERAAAPVAMGQTLDRRLGANKLKLMAAETKGKSAGNEKLRAAITSDGMAVLANKVEQDFAHFCLLQELRVFQARHQLETARVVDAMTRSGLAAAEAIATAWAGAVQSWAAAALPM